MRSTVAAKPKAAFACLCLILVSALMVITASQTRAQGRGRDPVVLLSTTKGPIAIRVFAGMVPRTASNFLDLVNRGYYDGKIFHRVENWVVQGGCPYGTGRGNFVDPDTGETRFIPLEINRNLGHGQAGMVAMARSADPNSASCQFYILKQPMPRLNGQYAVFGMVVGGLQNIYRIGIGDRILSARLDGPTESQSESSADPEPTRSTRETTDNAPHTGGQGKTGGAGGSSESGF